jgi:hypothetical protein
MKEIKLNKLIGFLVIAACAAGCNTYPYLSPRSPAADLPMVGPNMAHARQASLDTSLQSSLQDQEDIDNWGWLYGFQVR